MYRNLLIYFFYAGVTTLEQNSTNPNPYPGTSMTSNSDSSITGVVQQTVFGDIDNVADEFYSNIASLNKQHQEWQEKFQEQMNAFNMNFQKQMLQNLQYSLSKIQKPMIA